MTKCGNKTSLGTPTATFLRAPRMERTSCGGSQAWSKASDSGSDLAGVTRFKSWPPHPSRGPVPELADRVRGLPLLLPSQDEEPDHQDDREGDQAEGEVEQPLEGAADRVPHLLAGGVRREGGRVHRDDD